MDKSLNSLLIKILLIEGSSLNLAKKLRCQKTSVSKWINGKRNIPLYLCQRIIDTYDFATIEKLRPDLFNNDTNEGDK